MCGSVKNRKFLCFRIIGSGSGTVAQRVAVVMWQWYRSKEEIRAVRLVPVRMWQWQYWPRYGWLNVWQYEKLKNFKFLYNRQWQWHSLTTGGSGRVAVVPFERGDQDGSNGTG
jgi:hypothetical protein